jgi:hypothetical protein
MRARLVVVLFPSIGKVSSLFDRCEGMCVEQLT